MTRVIAQLWTSLDGFASGPRGEGDLFADLDPSADHRSQQHNLSLVPACDHVLLGRTTYEAFAAYWPTADEAIAELVNASTKVVASRTIGAAPWPGHEDARVVADAVEHVRRHRAAGGGDVLVWGSLGLVASLHAAGELDELDLFVVPLVLGSGVPALPGTSRLHQVSSEDWGSVTHARYAVVRDSGRVVPGARSG